MESNAKATAPATARNREPILAILSRIAPRSGLVLEIASGSGEHAVFFAAALPGVEWQPTDLAARSLASIAAHREAARLPNLLPPLALDVMAPDWPVARADMIVCINMIHISPWAASVALMARAARILPDTGILYLYGPYRIGGRHISDSNRAFDEDLRTRNPDWGVRDLDDVVSLAAKNGLRLRETVAMPSNNQSVIFCHEK